MKKIKMKLNRYHMALFFILLLSSILNFANMGIEGYANQYYAAGVKSMTMSLKNFFFVSFDPGGFVSIDKPPLGFWIQAVSAKIFGFSGFSIILPQALSGVLSVAVIYILVKRSFGRKAGLISALCLAVTPVFVAVSRNNTIDNLLVLTLLLACYALTIAAERGKLKYLILCFFLIGLGFNIKMLQAYMIIPAVYLTYLFTNTISIKKKIMHLIVGTMVLGIVSLSWAVIVDLVPAESRPFVGSSTNNTEMELIFGHNGMERLGLESSSDDKGGNFAEQGQSGMMSEGRQIPDRQNKTENMTGNAGKGQGQIPGGPGGFMPGDKHEAGKGSGGGNVGGSNFGGNEEAGLFRLFLNNNLSDQIIWLFPLAVIGGILAVLRVKLCSPSNLRKKLSLMLWFMWLLPVFLYFSFTTGLFHPYYLTMMAPPIAALTGIGMVSMWDLYKKGGWKAWILPAACIIDGCTQLLLLSYFKTTSEYTKPIMILVSVFCFVFSALMVLFIFMKQKGKLLICKKIMVITACIGLLLPSFIWSATTVFYASSGTFPSAGFELMSGGEQKGSGILGMNHIGNDTTQKLIGYLLNHKKNEKYLAAVPSANSYASDMILKTGEPVMALGGFSGSDKIVTVDQLKEMVDKGVVRYAVINGGGRFGESNEINSWIREKGKQVSIGNLGNSENDLGEVDFQLYDLKPENEG